MTDLTTLQDIPLKRCTLCRNEYPATPEYFTRDKGNKDGLRPQCKVCYRQKQKGWRRAEPERYAGYAHEYYLNNPDKTKKRAKEWQQSPKGKSASREYYLRTIDRMRAYSRQRYLDTRDDALERASRWQRENPEKREVIRQRYAARRSALPVDFTDADWLAAIAYFGGCCAACGRPPGLFHKLAPDHWLPLAGENCPGTIPSNIIPLCHGDDGCNNSKQDRHHEEWLTSRFGKRQAKAVMQRVQAYFSQVR